MSDDRSDLPATNAESPKLAPAGTTTPVSPAKESSPGAEGTAKVQQQRQTVTATRVEGEDGEDDRVIIGDPEAPLSPVSDPEGKRSNRIEGTIQTEPRAEDLPPDAKVTPIATQLNPNAAQQSIGAPPQPEVVVGAEQPTEGKKEVTPDMRDATELLPDDEHSDEHDATQNAAEQAKLRADAASA